MPKQQNEKRRKTQTTKKNISLSCCVYINLIMYTHIYIFISSERNVSIFFMCDDTATNDNGTNYIA